MRFKNVTVSTKYKDITKTDIKYGNIDEVSNIRVSVSKHPNI